MLNKQPVDINFAQGLNTKADPKQVSIGQFLSLKNSVFTTEGLLQKRNGFSQLSTLPLTASYLTTFNGNLTAIGSTLQAYNQASETWVNRGNITPIDLKTLPLIRSNTNQTYADNVIAPNGLMCTVFTDIIPVSGTPTAQYKYAIADSKTGQNIIAPTLIPNGGGVVQDSPRVFLLGNYFVIMLVTVIGGAAHLQYVPINMVTLTVGTNSDLATAITPTTGLNYDGVVANNQLTVAYNAASAAGTKVTSLSSTLVQGGTVTFASNISSLVALAADLTGSTPVIYVAIYATSGTTLSILAVNQQLTTVLTPTLIENTLSLANITLTAQNGGARVFAEVINTYTYDTNIASNYITSYTVTQAGAVGGAVTMKRGLGLASKAFLYGGASFFLTAYYSPYQPSYYLIKTNTGSGQIVAKLAYSNGGGYLGTGLPSVSMVGTTASTPYLYKDLITAVNKNTNVPSGNQVQGIYAQLGVNLASFNLGINPVISAEIGQDLLLTGGLVSMYDGYSVVEQGFNLWPDSVELTASTTGGSMSAQQYYYQATYEWSDNQGNLYRSAPSIPVTLTTTGTTSSVTIHVPSLRATAKTANPVKIVVYRWSTAQQTYYQVTSITNPTLNDVTVDSVTIVDTLSDSAILGNNIIYTNGGVVEDIGPPATSNMALYQSRLVLIDAEDRNLLWFSKQVIENTPVEMSDLFTIYVAPTTGSQGSTGPMTAISALDDKLIIFKENAIYYLTGVGPDNTGANNNFSDPVFITSTVGCLDQNSIVFIPDGLMFQSNKGIWLLGRDLSTSYIGAPVEAYNSSAVKSALNIPDTNQVRFTLSNGVTLMYDYYYKQWGTFEGIPGISSTLYQDLHTFINSLGQVYQESEGKYLDGPNPVLLSFTTSWLKIAGLQGYQRAYFLYLLGTYISPHKLNVQIAYDYDSNATQQTLIQPVNYNAAYGGLPNWGAGSAWGGTSAQERWRIYLQRQRCQALSVSVQEQYDPSLGVAAGAGLTLSGLMCIIGVKKGSRTEKASTSAG